MFSVFRQNYAKLRIIRDLPRPESGHAALLYIADIFFFGAGQARKCLLSRPQQSSVLSPRPSALKDQTKPDMIEVACLPGGADSVQYGTSFLAVRQLGIETETRLVSTRDGHTVQYARHPDIHARNETNNPSCTRSHKLSTHSTPFKCAFTKRRGDVNIIMSLGTPLCLNAF